jgi:hypothetical protein
MRIAALLFFPGVRLLRLFMLIGTKTCVPANRPHSALADRTPAEFAARCSGGKDGGQTALENAARFPLSPRTTTTGIIANGNNPSILLLEVLT